MDRYTAPLLTPSVIFNGEPERVYGSQHHSRHDENIRTALELAGIGVAYLSRDGRITGTNNALCKMLGCTHAELNRQFFLEVLHPDGRDTILSLCEKANTGKITSGTAEARLLHKNGSARWAQLSLAALPQCESGLPPGHTVLIEDISKRKQAEEEHKRFRDELQAVVALAGRNRAQMEAVFQSMEDGVAVFAPNGRLLWQNRALAKLDEPGRHESIAVSLTAAATADSLTLADGEALAPEQYPAPRALRGEFFRDWEIRVCSAMTGRVWNLSCSGVPLYDATSRPALGVVIVRDMTEQVELAHSREQIKRRLQLAVDIAQVGLWEWDVVRDTCYYSPQWKQQLGYQAHELTESMSEWKSRLHPDDRERLQAELQSLLKKDGPRNRLEYRLRHRDGSYRWMIANAVSFTDARAQRILITGTQLDVTENKLAEQRVLAAAQHDALTGLPNRALIFEFTDRLIAAARRHHRQGAVLFIDLDRFKPINDLYGHETGDRLLKLIAGRLSSCVRKEDLVGRLGGDEFVIVLQRADDSHPATTVAQHVVDSLSAPFHLDSLSLSVSASIGISYFPQHGSDTDSLIRAADKAMYQTKVGGRGAFRIFTPGLDSHSDTSAELEMKLKQALDHGGLELHYQPVVDMRTKELISVEALLRLNVRPDQNVGPDRFVPIAESAGLIARLGEWVAVEACRQHEEWRHQGLPPVTIAINVSPLQFRQKGFAQRLQAIVREAGIEASRIQIEVTETTVMESVEDAIETLAAVRDYGIRVALDDFGSGYSNLSRLSMLPLDKLKVDQSLVRRLPGDKASRAVTGAIVALGRMLDLEVVGEGVEEEETLARLQEQGCHQIQGFFISRPLPPAEFVEWYRTKGRSSSLSA